MVERTRRLTDSDPEAAQHRAALALDAGEMGVLEREARFDAVDGDETLAES